MLVKLRIISPRIGVKKELKPPPRISIESNKVVHLYLQIDLVFKNPELSHLLGFAVHVSKTSPTHSTDQFWLHLLLLSNWETMYIIIYIYMYIAYSYQLSNSQTQKMFNSKQTSSISSNFQSLPEGTHSKNGKGLGTEGPE